MNRLLQHQKGVLALLFVLFLGMGTANAYDFYKTCSTGQRLYYNIIDATNHYVEITYPGSLSDPWNGYTQPTGNISLPSIVTYNSVTYTVTEIGDNAFSYCNGLTGTLTIPNSVTRISNYAFSGCTGFTGLTLGNSVTWIGMDAFSHCIGFTGSLTIPNSVTLINADAFWDCTGFTGTLTLGNSLANILGGAFEGCSGFTGTLTIPSSVTLIAGAAFRNCTGFTQVRYNAINCSDCEDGQYDPPFKGCHGTLIIGSSVQRIPAYMFYGCSGFTGSLTIPNSVTSIGDQAFRGCSGFTGSLTIGNSVTSIGNYAFCNCSGFAGSLIIGNSVTTIGNYAFSGCSNFSGGLTIPDSVTTIGAEAFQFCTGFTGMLTMGNSLTTIDRFAFYHCGFVGPLIIPNSVTTIGENAFGGCSGFTQLTIGNSVTTISELAFRACNNLTSMTVLPETPPTLGSDVFYYVSKAIPVYVPCASLEDYQAASQWSAFTNMQCRETLTMYEGTATNNRIPAYIYYFDDFARSQFVIPAADLEDMVGTTISSMTFYTTSNNVPYATVSPADVYMKEVGYTTISAYVSKASATTVYSGYFSILSTGSGGEMTINFSTPYTYNGGNLLVGIENTQDVNYKNIYFYGQTVSGASISGSNGSSTGTIPAEQQDFIPKTTFGYTPSDCSRPIGLTATDITSNSAMLNWTGFQDEYDVRYRTKPIFFEDFEHGLPSGWTTIDNDGDGYNWHSASNYGSSYCHSGSTIMVSASYDNNNNIALTPDNWLITPRLELQGTMKVWLSALHSNWAQEHFAIYLSTTGNSVSDFTTVLVPETTLTNDSYRVYTADLSAYAGQQGYIAIRHFNCTDMYELLLDDFGIFDNPIETGGWVTQSNIVSGYTISDLAPGREYECQVRGRDCNGSGTYTAWSAVYNFTTAECLSIVVDAANPFSEDFEGAAFVPACWENIPYGSNKWISATGQSHSSSHSAYSGWFGDIYLVLPDLELSANASSAQLSFWSFNSYPEDFAEGNNTVVLLDGGIETVLWSAETVSEEWVETTIDLTAYVGQIVSLAFKYAGDNGNGWYVDDVEVSASSITQTIALSTGINWFSTYIDITLDNLKAALVAALPGTTSIKITSQSNGTTTYNGTMWRGALNTLDVTQMYMIEVTANCEITLEGTRINPAEHPVTIHNGNNWIAFPLSGSMTLSNAFAGFAVNGDKVTSQSNGSATYTNQWRGQLSTLEPGKGYMYYSNRPGSINFIFVDSHEYVDLGLPSGTLWATCNLGANTPEDYGDYFAWGETQPKDSYSWDTYQYGDGTTFTKYTGSDGLTTLLPEDDAATANWGANWRMPTNEDWYELFFNTTCTWTTQNGVYGRLFTASNGNSLFLPTAGFRYESSLYYSGSCGYFWSSLFGTDDLDDTNGEAWYFGFNSDFAVQASIIRNFGLSVRAVRSAPQN